MTDPGPSTPRPGSEAELVELVRSIKAPAPESLHRKVDAMIAARAGLRRGGRRRAQEPARSYRLAPRLAALSAIATAAIVLALAFSLSGGSSTLSVRDAAALTIRPATQAPPAERRSDRDELVAAVDGVSFPYWGGRLGWHTSGSRVDHLHGRTVKTIFYENGRGQRIGYAIVSGRAPTQAGGVVAHRDGRPYHLQTIAGAPVITWLREGRLCVVSGHGVSGATLLRLASWGEHRSERS
jgi:hypothetical protein